MKLTASGAGPRIERSAESGKMYLERFWCDGVWDDDRHEWQLAAAGGKVRRWTLWQDQDPARLDLRLRLLACCLGATRQLQEVAAEAAGWRAGGRHGGELGALLAPGPGRRPREIRYRVSPSGRITPGPGSGRPLGGAVSGPFAYAFRPPAQPVEAPEDGFPPRSCGSRFATLWDRSLPLTPASRWLFHHYCNGTRHASVRAKTVYNVAVSAITAMFPDLELEGWSDGGRPRWRRAGRRVSPGRLPLAYRRGLAWLTDLVRQMADAGEGRPDFHLRRGLLVIHGLEKLVAATGGASARRAADATCALAEVFPNLQFLVTSRNRDLRRAIRARRRQTVPRQRARSRVTAWLPISAREIKRFPQQRNRFRRHRFAPRAPARRDTVVLVDVDSAIPNLALMKLSRFFKQRRRQVLLARESAPHVRSDKVLASCVFRRPGTETRVERLRSLHGESLQLGGSGVDPALRLPPEIEGLMPDYTLYPEVDFGLGFLTRGCPHVCPFCIVPQKEGALRQVASFEDLLPPGWRKLVLLDDNLLAFSGAADLLRQMIRRRLAVNFNQTLDLRHLTAEKARLLTRVDSRNYHFTRRMYYLSLNSTSHLRLVRERLEMLRGVKRSEMTFVCMYGFDTTLSEDIERFAFLRQMRVLPFVQEYLPIGPSRPSLDGYFDGDPEPLARLHFPRNGRNFEGFLKWVSRQYALRFGKLHMPLVDRIFQYNHRERKQRYVDTLAGTSRS